MTKHLTSEPYCVGWGEEERAFQVEGRPAAQGKKLLGKCKQLQAFQCCWNVKCEVRSDNI